MDFKIASPCSSLQPLLPFGTEKDLSFCPSLGKAEVELQELPRPKDYCLSLWLILPLPALAIGATRKQSCFGGGKALPHCCFQSCMSLDQSSSLLQRSLFGKETQQGEACNFPCDIPTCGRNSCWAKDLEGPCPVHTASVAFCAASRGLEGTALAGTELPTG